MKYRATGKNLEGSLVLKYDLNGVLVEFEIHAKLNESQIKYLRYYLPFTTAELDEFKKATSLILKEIPEDLSFDRFWNEYNYKRGNKARTEKLWKLLKDNDRAAVFHSIPKYNYFLSCRPNQDKAYPETYLAQKRYENEY